FFSSRRRHTRFSRDWSSDVCSSDLYIVFSSHKEILVEKGIVTTVILIKINVVIKEFFELTQFFVKKSFYLFLSVRLFGFDFINSVIVNQFGNKGRFLVFEKINFLLLVFKPYIQHVLL